MGSISNFKVTPLTIILVIAVVVGYFVISGLSKRRK